MTVFVPVVMFGWVPVVLLLFWCMRPRQAVITSFLVAWLFLPMAGYRIQGLPDYTKMLATSTSVVLGMALFDSGRFRTFRPHWVDLPMVVWCLVDLPTSISNGLGVYDGLSGVLNHVITWGLPYFIGRLYLSEPSGLRALAIAIFIGGLIYVPLCLWEMRMSPNLHHWVYGFHPHRFLQAIRWGGYRPMVFMKNGLMVAMWMAAASVTGFWLWRIGGLKRLWNVPTELLVGVLMVTTVLCKTVGAVALLIVGIGVTLFTRWTRTRLPLLALLAVPPIYMCLRTTQTWSGRDLVELVRTYVDETRASSFEGRLEQEDLFSAKAWRRPIFGWGGYGRMRPTDALTGQELTRGIDSLWIIVLGGNGLVGLIAWVGVMLLPPLVFLWRYPLTHRGDLLVAAPAALVLVVLLYTVDCLANGLINPIFILAIGGIAGFASEHARHVAPSRVQAIPVHRDR